MLCLVHSAAHVHECLQMQTVVMCQWFLIDSACVLKLVTPFLRALSNISFHAEHLFCKFKVYCSFSLRYFGDNKIARISF